MTIRLGDYGIWRHVEAVTPALAQEAESLGYGTLWVGNSPPADLEVVEELLAATTSITVATGIVNMWASDPADVAASYHRLAAAYPDRFLLGVGIGHPEFDREYASPFATMTGYLAALAEYGVPADRQVLAALAPKAVKLAAAQTAGIHPYLTTPAHTRWARDLVGPGVLVAPEQMVALDDDPARALAMSQETVEGYLDMSNYTRTLARTGYTAEDLTPPGSERLVNDLILRGTPESIADGLKAHLEAGADHVAVQALPQDESDPLPTYRALAEVLFRQLDS